MIILQKHQLLSCHSLKEDLFRRDFTINAMAIQLNKDQFGQLIDFFHGYDDILQRKVRILYNLSFVEDPTRILRSNYALNNVLILRWTSKQLNSHKTQLTKLRLLQNQGSLTN
ncbi:CCA tRNA nucleotidyltransferase [Anaerobacillus sp. HL2]|nr:CCA tRNA nucleotidyltransferase [Anaerobacillus sp. HL2]